MGRRLLDYDLHQIDVSLQPPDRDSYALRNAGGRTFEDYVGGFLNSFSSYMTRERETIFKFRFLNTRFPEKSIEKRIGPIKVISSTQDLRRVFRNWTERIYEILRVNGEEKSRAFGRIGSLVSYKWNVVEVYPKVFFETYLLDDWGHAFEDERIRDAWAGYCFGMRDHFGILYNGDVTLCSMDFDGRTAVGNPHVSSLGDILSSEDLGEIIRGFRRFKLFHPHCRRCLGSTGLLSWLLKPVASVLALTTLKPFFYTRTRL